MIQESGLVRSARVWLQPFKWLWELSCRDWPSFISADRPRLVLVTLFFVRMLGLTDCGAGRSEWRQIRVEWALISTFGTQESETQLSWTTAIPWDVAAIVEERATFSLHVVAIAQI